MGGVRLKNTRIKLFLTFILIMITNIVFFGITVYGGVQMELLNDTGSSAGSWTNLNDEVASTSSLKNGPSSGNGGTFYYFKNDENGTREMADAEIARTVNLNENQKILCNLGQLKVAFSLDYYGWSEDSDRFKVRLYSNGKTCFYDSGYYTGDKSWKRLQMPEKILAKGTTSIKIEIYADRESGDDLDVYLDNIRLWVYDDFPPVMTSVTVTEIRGISNDVVPLKKDESTGQYLVNWVNISDTIHGRIEYNEPVTASEGYDNLKTNILGRYGKMLGGNIINGSASDSHEYRIPITNADRLKEGDSNIKFEYSPDGSGPFYMPVRDLVGNDAQYVVRPNIEKYNLKLDNATPQLITPWNSYETFVPSRTSIDIVVREEDRGTEQSPLTLTYYWKYNDANNEEVIEPEKKMLLNNTVVPVKDGTNTTYTIKIDVPNGTTIPPYQNFLLFAEVWDESRMNGGDNYIRCSVNQKDNTPPVITWDKSIHEDGTEVDISGVEDILYTTSRMVSFSVEDDESDVEEVKYLWTREPYNAESDRITKMILPVEDTKYKALGTSLDNALEGLSYLNILVKNKTATERVYTKAFYFDNESPRASGEIIYTSGNPTSAQYQVQDRALQNKLLYTLLASDPATFEFETVAKPDLSEGIKDNGMWKALELDGAEGTERTANIVGVLDKVTQTGSYKLVTRFYDEFYNYTEIENQIWYDFIPPKLEVLDVGNPKVFQKNHEVVIRVTDNISGTIVSLDKFSINWIDVGSGDIIPASFEIMNPQLGTIGIGSNEKLSGKYYLNIKVSDFADNIMDEMLFINGSHAEFCFDNTPPSVKMIYDNEKVSKAIQFAYSELKDAYAGIELFKYGISDSPDIEPLEWIDINHGLSEGNIIYPKDFMEDGEWYLYILIQDTLGNEQVIESSEPFRIDVTKPLGSIDFSRGYANKLDVALQLKVDELTGIERKTFKTILSNNKTMLEGIELSEVQSTDWKDISYENGVAIYTWKLSDMVDGEQRVYARFVDDAGNLSDIYEAAVILDRTAPTGEIAYDIASPTTGNVTATLTIADSNAVTLLNNNQVSSYVFNRNGEFEFIFMDEAGNKTRTMTIVENIDKDPPEATITYSHPRDVWTNESIIATLNLVDSNGSVILGDGTNTHIFTENGEYTFQFKDNLGNEGSIKAKVKNIDKVAPVGRIIYTYSDTAPVTVYLAVYEPVEVTNNAGSSRYVFEENGEFTFEFEDKAGNYGEANAVVDTITNAKRYIDVSYSDSGSLTNKDINVEFKTFSDFAIITSPTVAEEVYGPYEYSFTNNGDWPVSIRVLSGTEAGKTRTVTGSVYNIDKISPEAEVYIHTVELTNQNVTATLLAYDDKGKAITMKNNGGESEYVFAENGTFTFDFTDEAGNVGHKTVTISNIDKSIPSAKIRYFTEESKGNTVFAEVYFPGETEEVDILNNNGLDTFEFVENGAFTFQYADKAGNKGSITSEINSLSDGVLSAIIEYYIEGVKVDDPNANLINKSVTAKLVLNEAGGLYKIVNNGGNNTHILEQNGEYTFIYEDDNGNRGFATAKVSSIDKEAPKLQILADIVKATNQDVIITVSYSDNKGISEIMLNGEAVGILPEGKFTYICTNNQPIEVKVYDTAGNMTVKEYIVNYIDKEMPIGTMTYTPSSATNQEVKAVLTLNESGKILNNSGRMEYVFTQNGDFTFEFEDIAGNKAVKTATVNWIDKTPPELSLEYSSVERTNKPIVVTLKTEEDAIILNNGGATKRTFYTNGEFIFRVADKAGNEVSIKAQVENIDAEKPQITLKGNTYISIMQNEAYLEPGYSATDNMDGDMTRKVIVVGSVNAGVPGLYILKYKVSDAVGNISENTRTVKVIGLGEIVLVLNGKVVDGDLTVLNNRDVTISGIGNEGSYIIKWVEGKRTQAYFKSEGNKIITGGTPWLESGKWYTFFIQDKERKTKSIQVYINE